MAQAVDAIAPPGSNAALLGIVDRIQRLTQHDKVVGALIASDVDCLMHRASEAKEVLEVSQAAAVGGGGSLASRPVIAAVPCLCALAVECINVVERAELSTGLARLVTTGCEVLAALLAPRCLSTSEEALPEDSNWSYDWVEETLEDLCDQLDFLALEVYCGLGRLGTEVLESDALPAELLSIDPDRDDFGSYWGTIEHRQALQELASWLLCVVFRAMGYGVATARTLMVFANNDPLCLCALLQGLLASKPGGGLPHDARELQGVALTVLCGLTAPELAFPYEAAGDAAAESIEERNRVLAFYLECVSAAVVETGVLDAALEALPGRQLAVGPGAAFHAEQFLTFLATLVLQADDVQATPDDPFPPALRLRGEILRRADRLGSLLEALLSARASAEHSKGLLSSCAILTFALARQGARPEAPDEPSDDGFTLACRVLLQASLFGDGQGPAFVEIVAPSLAALAALAANVGDLELARERLAELAAALPPADRARARARLTRSDRMRLPIRCSLALVLELLGPEDVAVATEVTPTMTDACAPAVAAPAAQPPLPPPAAGTGLRDIVQNAPKEFRCALDGKLLCDPVVSPFANGVVFERSTLVRWMQQRGAQCPVTGEALSIEACQRLPELRRRITEWVRGEGRAKPSTKKKKGVARSVA